MSKCPATFGDFRCALPVGHDGPHEADIVTEDDLRSVSNLDSEETKRGWVEWQEKPS